MGKLQNTIKINVSPEKVWAVVGNLGGVHTWITGVTSCRVEGNKRYCEMVNIGGFSEDLSDYSDEKRSYRYTIPAQPNVPVKFLKGKLSVEPEGKGSRVVWNAEFEPLDAAQEKEITGMLDGIYKQSLETLRRQFEK